jgi:surface protein
MRSMFAYAATFNQDISLWNTSNVTGDGMNGMFYYATSFNQPISSWNTSSVTNMSMMFAIANSFNQDISGWDVSNVTVMDSMFTYEYGPKLEIFNQDLSDWNVDGLTSAQGFCKSMSKANYDALLIGWTGWSGGSPTKTVQSGVKLNVFSTKYTLSGGDAAAARNYLVTTKGWQISDGGGE